MAVSLDSELVGMTSGEVPRGDLELVAVGPLAAQPSSVAPTAWPVGS